MKALLIGLQDFFFVCVCVCVPSPVSTLQSPGILECIEKGEEAMDGWEDSPGACQHIEIIFLQAERMAHRWRLSGTCPSTLTCTGTFLLRVKLASFLLLQVTQYPCILWAHLRMGTDVSCKVCHRIC